jgi:hypothetical protein
MKNPSLVSIIMGSQSDWSTMIHASKILKLFNIKHEVKIISDHRTPKRMFEYAERAEQRGIEIIIAGAGGAAHLPGMTASISNIPVLGVPIESKKLKGLDSLVLLHAYILYLIHPKTKKLMQFTAPLFSDMKEKINQICKEEKDEKPSESRYS